MNALGKILTTVFGFMWQQPLHKTLRLMRLLQVGLIINSQALLWYIAITLQRLDPIAAVGAYSAIAITLIPMIWKAVDSLGTGIKEDDQ